MEKGLALLHTVTHSSRIHDVRFVKHPTKDEQLLLVAAEDKKLSIYSVSADETIPPHIIAEMVGHSNRLESLFFFGKFLFYLVYRVKAVDTLLVSIPDTEKITSLVATISSDGKILIFDLGSITSDLPVSGEDEPKVLSITAIGEYDTKGSRLTCLTLAEGGDEASVLAGKRKRGDDESGSEEDE